MIESLLMVKSAKSSIFQVKYLLFDDDYITNFSWLNNHLIATSPILMA